MASGVVAERAPARTDDGLGPGHDRPECCGLYHRAVELVGKRWSGAILLVLMDGPLRFCEVRQVVPDISDRLLSERMKELETRGLVERRVIHATPARVEYELTDMGRDLAPAIHALTVWGRRWLG